MSINFNHFLDSKPRHFILGLAIAFTALVWLLDYVTGPQISTSIFYLIPISLTVWYIDTTSGIFFAIASAVIWLITDILTNVYTAPLSPYWNAMVRLGFFSIVLAALASLKAARQRQEELMEFVVHDLRSPLSNMLTALDLLPDLIAEGDLEEARELINMSTTSGNRLLILINSLLDLARLESKKMPLELEKIYLQNCLNEAMLQVSTMAARKEITVALQEAPAELYAIADRELTLRILVNILGNAIKFSPAGSQISIGMQLAQKGVVQVCVSDQGPGIPQKWQRQAFEKFGQVQARKAGAAVGSGLGLAFCKLAVEAQGGQIWFEPGDPLGTVVCFTYPGSD